MPEGTLQRMLAKDEQPIIMDGGMGTTIEDRGIDVRTAIWGSYCFVDGQGRKINDQIHADYVDAGARILIANTHNTRRAKCVEFLERLDASALPNNVADVASSNALRATLASPLASPTSVAIASSSSFGSRLPSPRFLSTIELMTIF